MLWTWRIAPLGKRISHGPGRATIGGSVDMNFVALRVVEIFAPEDVIGRSDGNVQGTSAAEYSCETTELAFAGSQSNNCARHGGDEMSGGKHCQGMKAIAKETEGEREGGTQASPSERTIFRNAAPFDLGCADFRAEQAVATRCIEYVAIPGERTQAGKTAIADQAPTDWLVR